MWGLILTTLLTSAADSLNPIATTQQFVLQGLVKKPGHIWYFILPTGITNLVGGFLAYFGLVALIGSFLGKFVEKYGRLLFTAELILGIVFLIGAGFLIRNSRTRALKNRTQAAHSGGSAAGADDEAEAAHKIKSVSPAALVALGVGATISELTTALPYFAFLAILFNYRLALPELTFVLVLYNIIYMLPLMILYFVYMKAQDKFDYLYKVIKAGIAKWANILAPALIGVIGVVLVYHSVSLLIK